MGVMRGGEGPRSQASCPSPHPLSPAFGATGAAGIAAAGAGLTRDRHGPCMCARLCKTYPLRQSRRQLLRRASTPAPGAPPQPTRPSCPASRVPRTPHGTCSVASQPQHAHDMSALHLWLPSQRVPSIMRMQASAMLRGVGEQNSNGRLGACEWSTWNGCAAWLCALFLLLPALLGDATLTPSEHFVVEMGWGCIRGIIQAWASNMPPHHASCRAQSHELSRCSHQC